MNIPQAIKVGHYTYDIKESDELISIFVTSIRTAKQNMEGTS